MPISRAAFQIRMPGSLGNGAKRVAHTLKYGGGAAEESRETIQRIDVSTEDSDVASNFNAEADQGAKENPPEIQAKTLPSLPSADAPSAGNPDAIGPTQPKTEARRSVATGRDAPQTGRVLREHEVNEADRGLARAQTQMIEGRLQSQKSTTAEHLTRIHTIVGRLLELTEAHLSDGDRKLQSLEHKLAQVEMRYGVNRSSP